jgi:hypothetical protein
MLARYVGGGVQRSQQSLWWCSVAAICAPRCSSVGVCGRLGVCYPQHASLTTALSSHVPKQKEGDDKKMQRTGEELETDWKSVDALCEALVACQKGPELLVLLRKVCDLGRENMANAFSQALNNPDLVTFGEVRGEEGWGGGGVDLESRMLAFCRRG